MKIPNWWKRLESCSKQKLMEKIVLLDRKCERLRKWVDAWQKLVEKLKSENVQLEEDKKNLIRANKKKTEYIEELECAINELMAQCDIKYFRFRDKEFYKQKFTLNLSSKKK